MDILYADFKQQKAPQKRHFLLGFFQLFRLHSVFTGTLVSVYMLSETKHVFCYVKHNSDLIGKQFPKDNSESRG